MFHSNVSQPFQSNVCEPKPNVALLCVSTRNKYFSLMCCPPIKWLRPKLYSASSVLSAQIVNSFSLCPHFICAIGLYHIVYMPYALFWKCYLFFILVLSPFDYKVLSKWISEVGTLSYFSYSESQLQSHEKTIFIITRMMALLSLFRYALTYEYESWLICMGIIFDSHLLLSPNEIKFISFCILCVTVWW